MPDPNMTTLPAQGSTAWYTHYSELDAKVRTKLSPGKVYLDDFAGATDDDKLTAAFSYIAAQSSQPALQLPGRDVTFSQTRTIFSGMRIYGASGTGPKSLEQSSGKFVPCRVRINSGFGTSSWLYSASGNLFDVEIKNIAFHAINSNAQLMHVPAGTLYACEFSSCQVFGFKHAFGVPGSGLSSTQVVFRGNWQCHASQDVQFTLRGSDLSLWNGGSYLNITSNGSVAGAGRYLMRLESVQKSPGGEPFFTIQNDWRGLMVTGGSAAYGTSFYGARFEGAESGGAATKCYGNVVRMTGGGLSLDRCWFGHGMTQPTASEHGYIEVTGGNLDLDRPTFNHGAGSATTPLLYITGGKYYLRAAASNTEEQIEVKRATTVTNGSDSSVNTTTI